MVLVGESFQDAKAQVAAEVTGEPRMLLKTIASSPLGSIVLMSAKCMTDWTWPQAQVAISRRLLLHGRKAGDARWRPSEHMPRYLGLTIR